MSELQRSRAAEQKAAAAQQRALDAYITASTQLTHFKKVYKKIYSKEYCLVEQSLCELEAEEVEVAKMGSIPTVVETVYILVVESLSLMACTSPLADLFFFNSSFSQLLDLLFYNTL